VATFQALKHPAFHPTRSAQVRLSRSGKNAGEPVARLGQLHPEVAAQWKIKRDVYLAQIDLEAICAAGPRLVRYRAPSRFPISERDLSFIFADRVSWAEIVAVIQQLGIDSLARVAPLEVFRGVRLREGTYSLLLRLTFQRDDRTLRDDEVQAATARIAEALNRLGGEQRK
jgi:phenylalanyl-tRNA synthetase beta chain